jgi:hypothetical protein
MRPRNSGRYTVLEGNRRLAALRVLTDPSLAAEAGFQVPGYTADAAAIALDQPRQAAVNGLSGLRSLPRRRTGDWHVCGRWGGARVDAAQRGS